MSVTQHPAQISACTTNAPGSHPGCLMQKRLFYPHCKQWGERSACVTSTISLAPSPKRNVQPSHASPQSAGMQAEDISGTVFAFHFPSHVSQRFADVVLHGLIWLHLDLKMVDGGGLGPQITFWPESLTEIYSKAPRRCFTTSPD